MRLLVLDDERGIVAFIGTVARDRGWTVDSAVTGEEFRARFDENRPDAVTLDLQLGGADGVEQLRFLKDQGFGGPIVLLSGFDKRVLDCAQQVGEALGLRIPAALEKPVRIARLREVLKGLEEDLVAVAAEPAATPARPAIPAGAVTPDTVLSALTLGEMDLFLQPVVAATDRAIIRFEALIRWRHPELGILVPDEFIPAAERDEATIDFLTFWVVRQAAECHRQLALRGHSSPISVNMSGVNLRDLDLPDRMAALVDSAQVPRRAIEFEITESVATIDPDRTTDILTRLRLKGFALAMDDFGTGYSSLKALQKMPFSELKIDKSFVAGLPNSAESQSIVTSVIGLARSLQLACVAEGVETAEAGVTLTRLGASALQGYYFSRPVPAEAALDWADAWAAASHGTVADHRLHGK